MARITNSIFICLAFLLMAGQASALQLTNRDAADHKLVVTEAGTTKELIVKPSQTLEDVCAKDCTIKMPDGEEYEFDGSEMVSIEEGLMFLDEPSDGVGSDVNSGEPLEEANDPAAKKD